MVVMLGWGASFLFIQDSAWHAPKRLARVWLSVTPASPSPPPYAQVFSSAEKFEEWFSMGDGGKEKEAEVVQQLHKVRLCVRM